ncbi:MAG: tetratricopeptide repeat protein [bacterium]|nr:tetratricopeptide repeat protein [bacterium]
MTAETSHSLEDLERRWQVDKTPQVGLRLAEEHRKKGDLSASIDVLATGLEVYPDHTASRVALSRYLVDSERFADAVLHLERIVKLDPTHLVANKLLVGAYTGIGRFAEARDKLDIYEMMGEGDADIERLRALLEAAERGDELPVAEPEDALPPPSDDWLGKGEELAVAEPVSPLSSVSPPSPVSETEIGAQTAPDDFESDEPFGTAWTARGPAGYWQAVAEEGIFTLEAAGQLESELVEPSEYDLPGAGEPSPAAGAESTVTMGSLYLEQGHYQEAAAVFEDVLAREPYNEVAQRGLEAALEGETPAARDAGDEEEESTADRLERLRSVLIAYRAQLRKAVEAGV